MIGLLLVVLILGLMAAVTLNSLDFSNSIPSSLRATHSTSPAEGTADINQLSSPALVAACLADYVEISTAEQVYAALNSGPPSSGTSWAISLPVGQSQLATWPDGGKHFRIIWNGKAIEVRPRKGLESIGNAGTATERKDVDPNASHKHLTLMFTTGSWSPTGFGPPCGVSARE